MGRQEPDPAVGLAACEMKTILKLVILRFIFKRLLPRSVRLALSIFRVAARM